MHPYIPHLLEDILAAHQKPQLKVPDVKNLEDIIEDVGRLKEEPGHTLGYYCGLKVENFPPSEQLTRKDMLLVSQAFKKMMFSWNIKCSLPAKLPAAMSYSLLIKILDRRILPGMFDLVTFNYCNLNPSACKLKEYCTCRKREAEGFNK